MLMILAAPVGIQVNTDTVPTRIAISAVTSARPKLYLVSLAYYTTVCTNGKDNDRNHGEKAAVLVVVVARYPHTPTICDNGN